ncbi:MAG: hypothetical protein JKY84_02475 [Emcibacteraceae bacterium]|nr:hypothetical protein [Emcibacteraceae bacterium]
MMFNDIKKNFASRAAAVSMGATAIFSPLTAVFAADSGEEAAPQVVQQTHEIASVETASHAPITISDRAGYNAARWAEENPGIGVIVEIGYDTEIPTEAIVDLLTQDIMSIRGENGEQVETVEFFFKESKVNRETGVGFVYGSGGTPNVNVMKSRPLARETATSYLWRQSKPSVAYQYD